MHSTMLHLHFKTSNVTVSADHLHCTRLTLGENSFKCLDHLYLLSCIVCNLQSSVLVLLIYWMYYL